MLPRFIRYWTLLLAIAFGTAPTARTAEPPQTIFKFEEVDTKPAPKRPVRVYFPRTVRRKKEVVQILLRFVVKTDGRVDQITVVKFSNPAMIVPALEAYSEARFTPGTKDGHPVNTWMEFTESAAAL